MNSEIERITRQEEPDKTVNDAESVIRAIRFLRNQPAFLQDLNLVLMCKLDKTGRFERLSRILAEHKVPVEEVFPCMMDIFLDMLEHPPKEGESLVPALPEHGIE